MNTSSSLRCALRPFGALAAASLLFVATACGGEEYTYDSASLFPENYQTSYTKSDTYDCTLSPTHGNDHVIVYYSPEILDAYANMEEPPEGAVSIKEQYTDETCTELSSIKVLQRKDASASKYAWQDIGADGSVSSTEDENFCSGCHLNDPCVNGLCAY